jgi:hypothetical protein
MTPIQELIANLKKLHGAMATVQQQSGVEFCITEAEKMPPKEREAIEQAFDVGMKRGYYNQGGTGKEYYTATFSNVTQK